MTVQILTEVSATVAPEREADLLAAYQQTLARPLPDGLLRSELLQGADGQWRIHTLWRDQEALDAMRTSPEGPIAPRLFRDAGADPHVAWFQVAAHHLVTDPRSWP
ncbi:antibiotic biosynthesis monooxygenase family protein [Streptacidiphilus jiangxiensis]|uniref:Antibiotic biosynthesis monooxygenase n=1 Tax=Streptacidiphilus jiangxiensis TaxID=235985 RepID=A0A1H7WG43_STRJI|nr:antibiotic biosynthesis monooxygenase [Streptacidiphilus jiangxiensis]SEM20039.1 Antibiotic biosynthesis monooxygenase [Streptacidiphilus jiangxiensis]